MSSLDKSVATETMIKCMENIVRVSNSNLVLNADRLLSKRGVDVPVDWVGNNKIRVPKQKFKSTY